MDSKTDFYIPEPDDLKNFQPDPTIILKKPFLTSIFDPSALIKETKPPCDINFEWYPYANSYYPYTEDVDAVARVNHLLATKPSFVSITSSANDIPLEESSEICNEKSARLNYLQSKPVCFIILGKPELGEQEVAKNLANYWQCVYLDPEILIQQEIDSGTRAGQCIEFNLRCGRAIGIDVILRLLEKRVRSQTVQHRGYVLCGFPLIPNDLYEEDPVSSESAIFNVREIFDDILDITVEIGVPPKKPHVSIASRSRTQSEPDVDEEQTANILEEDEKPPDIFSKDIPMEVRMGPMLDLGVTTKNICGGEPDIGVNFEDQLNFIFSMLEKPYLIIYISCPTPDVITQRKARRFDLYSNMDVDIQREASTKMVYEFFESGAADNEIFDELFDSNYFNVNSTSMKHLVKLPRNFPANVGTQLDRYHTAVLNHIEQRVLLHDPQYFIKVDGRTNPTRMFGIIKSRLKILPLQKVLLPAKLNVHEEEVLAEGYQPANVTNLDGLTLEECFNELCRRQTISPLFKWTWSDWGIHCPVSMKYGMYRKGDAEYAVRFMDQVYFLSSAEAFFEFSKNPRPFLLPPLPISNCKIFVFGPQHCCKTAVSQALAIYLNGESLVPQRLSANFLNEKKEQVRDKVKQGALAEAVVHLNELRETEAVELEEQRLQKIKDWVIDVRVLLKDMLPLLQEEEQQRKTLVLSSFPMPLAKTSDDSLSGSEKEKLLRRIKEMGVDAAITVKSCNTFLKNEKKLLEYLPKELQTSYKPVPATIFDDFVEEYVQTKLETTDLDGVNLDAKDFLEMFQAAITTAEEIYMQKYNYPGGWIVDGMTVNLELVEALYPDFMPDEVVLLNDTEDYEFLIENYNEPWTIFSDYREFFHSIGKTDAAWRSPSSMESSNRDFVRGILNELLDESNFPYDLLTDGEVITLKVNEAYKKSLLKFNTDWPKVRKFFDDHDISVTEVNVTNRTVRDVMIKVIKKIDDHYRVVAEVFSEQERAEEMKNYMDQKVGEEQDEMFGEGGDTKFESNTFELNRRYGDTLSYCPVAFKEDWVLWKGKEDFAVMFKNKVYLLSSEESYTKFLDCAYNYIPECPVKFPPPRVCLIGGYGVEKTATAGALAKNLGVPNVDFDLELKKHFKIDADVTLDKLRRDIELSGEDLNNYLNATQPLPEKTLHEMVHKFWFNPNAKYYGFVLNGFPKRLTDIEYMINKRMIPDIIIQLVANDLTLHDQLLEKVLNNWQEKTNAKILVIEEENKNRLEEWEKNRQVRFQQLLDEKRETRYNLKMSQVKMEEVEGEEAPETTELPNLPEVPEESEGSIVKIASQVSFDSVAEQEDLDQVNKVLDEEFPPVELLEADQEPFEEVREKFETDIQDSLNFELDALLTMKEACRADNIIWKDVALQEDEDKTIREVYYVTDEYKFRNPSLFETCFEVSIDMAERLLECGYYFLSKFGRTCPVQYYEDANPIQMYLPLIQEGEIYPVIHRQMLYFLSGLNNVVKFKQNPLKYLNNDFRFPLIPFRIAINGPPKCGKSILAERLKQFFGFKVVSRGSAARYVLGYLPFSALAQNMETVLRNGWELTDEMVVKAVEAACFDSRVVTQGVVFDGFPNAIYEQRHMSYFGLVPHLVVNLQAELVQVLECLHNDTGKRSMRRFADGFMKHLYKQWSNYQKEFSTWLNREYQNATKMSIINSNWEVWDHTRDLVMAVSAEIKHYYKHISEDWPLRLSNMLVTPLEFLERQSSFKNYCPVCLHYTNALECGGDPPERTGLIQYRKFFYWICPKHVYTFLDIPDQFIAPYNANSLPEHLPKKFTLTAYPKPPAQNGCCLVCYVNQKIIEAGSFEYCIDYNHQIYLFNSEECMKQFVHMPANYNVEINFSRSIPFPSLSYTDLPVLGMLEQYVAKDIIEVLSTVIKDRPVIPGLTVEVSAAIGVALRLKCKTKADYTVLYEKALELYEMRRTKLLENLDTMKNTVNPYLYYEEPMPEFHVPKTYSYASSTNTSSIKRDMENILDNVLDQINYDDQDA